MRALLALLFASLALAQPAKDRIVVVMSLDGFPAYALENPDLPAPTIRGLMAQGAAAKRMTTGNPSVTWPMHTTLVTGVYPEKHGVLFNGLLIGDGASRKIEPWRDKSEMVRVPTVYDLAHRAGLKTAQADWVAIQNPGTIDYEFAEIPNPEGAVAREMIDAGIITRREVEEFRKLPIALRDYYWTASMAHVIVRHKPNLVLLHLLNEDSTHHTYGARGLAAVTGYAYADTRVKEVLDALARAGLRDRATLILVSDHGFKIVRRQIHPNAIVKRAGLAGKVQVIPEGGTAMVYLDDTGLSSKVKALFAGTEGVERVVEPDGYNALGLPTPQQNRQMSELLLVAKDGYAFGGGTDAEPVVAVAAGATPGSHGYINSDPEMDAIFVVWGYGIRSGARLDRIDNRDVAPTVAALLGLRMDNIDGKPLAVLR